MEEQAKNIRYKMKSQAGLIRMGFYYSNRIKRFI